MTYRPEFSPFSVCVVLNGFYFCDGLALESKEEPKKKKKKVFPNSHLPSKRPSSKTSGKPTLPMTRADGQPDRPGHRRKAD